MFNIYRRLLATEEVAEVLAVKPARVYELCRQGILPHVKLGRQVRVDKVALDEFITGGGKALPGGWKKEA